MMIEMLDVIRVLVALSSFIYASWEDWKSREIPDFIWILMSLTGVVLHAIEFTLTAADFERLKITLLFSSFSIIFAFTVGLLLFYLDFFGGADSKALMALSILMPLAPKVKWSSAETHPFIPIAVFNNSVITASLMSIVMLSKNLIDKLRGEDLFKGLEYETIGKKILALITGYKISANKLHERSFIYPIEEIKIVNGKTIRKLRIRIGASSGEETLEQILKLIERGQLRGKIWVTPALPMLIFITIGLILALTSGDLAYMLALLLKQTITS